MGSELGKHGGMGLCTPHGVSLLGSGTIQHMDQLCWTKEIASCEDENHVSQEMAYIST